MAERQPTCENKYRALLIGNNYYPGTRRLEQAYPRDSNLRGCVHDVLLTKSFLEKSIGPNLVVIPLTSEVPPDGEDYPIDVHKSLSTYGNVLKALVRIVNKAQAGDHVYIHYSGHGTSMTVEELGDQTTSFLALILLDDERQATRLFRGDLLAKALRNLVAKGCTVNLTLDCCFSGSVLRGDNVVPEEVRYLDSRILTRNPNPTDEEDTLFGAEYSNRSRDAVAIDDWFVKPEGYTVITACAPEGRAEEINVGGTRRGALTHFLLQALQSLSLRSIEVTVLSLHQHLTAIFNVYWPKQTPMRYGNPNLTILGATLRSPEDELFPVWREGKSLRLGAGTLQGVCPGNRFFACSFDTSEIAKGQVDEGSANVQVESCTDFESLLTLLPIPCPEYGLHEGNIWKAKPLTSVSPRKITIGLSRDFDEVEKEWLSRGSRYLELTTCVFKVEICAKFCAFHGFINHRCEYKIRGVGQGMQKSQVPTININSDGSKNNFKNVLQHIAKIKYFEGLRNRFPNLAFQDSFSLSAGIVADSSNRANVRNNEKWTFEIENKGQDPIFVWIFDFQPSWGLKSLIKDSGYRTVKGRDGQSPGRKKFSIKMSVPDSLLEAGVVECEDVIKIFVAAKPSSMNISLPPISDTASGVLGILRGEEDLDLCIKSLGETSRGQGLMGWQCFNFYVRTVMETASE